VSFPGLAPSDACRNGACVALRVQGREGCFGDGDVLLDDPGARSDRTDDAPVDHDGDAAPEDDDFASIAMVDAEQGLARL
jgi:hypothetical protein